MPGRGGCGIIRSSATTDEAGERLRGRFGLSVRQSDAILNMRLARLTGLEMKMRQYVLGERFCREVRDTGGQELLARVWEGPDWLPTMAEIQRPQLFVERARIR